MINSLFCLDHICKSSPYSKKTELELLVNSLAKKKARMASLLVQ